LKNRLAFPADFGSLENFRNLGRGWLAKAYSIASATSQRDHSLESLKQKGQRK
jgi:hypothetical protein